MNNAVIHPGDKVTITLSLDDKDLSNNNNNEQTIKQSNRTIQGRPNIPKQENLMKQDKTPPRTRPSIMSRRTSSLLGLNIEGLLIVPELETRLRRRSYSGNSVHDDKETEVDPSDGMLTTSLCTTEL